MASRTVRLFMTIIVFWYIGNMADEYARENDMAPNVTQFAVGGAAAYFTWKVSRNL